MLIYKTILIEYFTKKNVIFKYLIKSKCFMVSAILQTHFTSYFSNLVVKYL